VREILATEMLEALGVYTSKTFSVVETGEALWRGDEPSPTRSAVLTRLSHGHIRIGSFQRLLVLEEAEHGRAGRLLPCPVPGPPPPPDAPRARNPRSSCCIRWWNAWPIWPPPTARRALCTACSTPTTWHQRRELRLWPMALAAALGSGLHRRLFRSRGRYAFGRQAEAIRWNCGQLAIALRLIAPETPPLVAALERFGPLYQAALAAAGAVAAGRAIARAEADAALAVATGKAMHDTGMAPDAFFHAHRGGRDLAAAEGFAPVEGALDDALWQAPAPSNVIEEVERVWSAIAEQDDWQPLHDHIAAIAPGRRTG
jgi:uncharacterized protein YdiU (UPF0061 family)